MGSLGRCGAFSFSAGQELRGAGRCSMEIMRRITSLFSAAERHENWRGPSRAHSASESGMDGATGEIFDEQYRVVAGGRQNLIIRGVRPGKKLTISPPPPPPGGEYPPGRPLAVSGPPGSPA